jgi:hypothetical protein
VYEVKVLRKTKYAGLINRTKRVIGIAALIMGGSIASLYAASSNDNVQLPATTSITGTVRVVIPFAFSIGDNKLSAGEYYIGPTGEKAVAIRSVAGGLSVVALTNAVSDDRQVSSPKLVFHRYGDQYFLTQAWLRTSDEGREFFISKEESKWAHASPRGEVTVIAMK